MAICILLTLGPSNAFAQNQPTSEYQLKAAFIYNFTRFVDWPANAFSSSDGPFVIGVLGDERFSTYIEELVKGEKLGGRSISVQRYGAGQIGRCNILFVSGTEASKIKNQLPGLNRRGTLTVSDASNFAKWGGIIRFFKEENKLRLQINIDEAKSSQLTISSKLLSLSKIYSAN